MKTVMLMLILTLSLSTVSAAQVHPYALGSLNLNGGGYSPVSVSVGAGVDGETNHVIGTAEADYEFVRKINDGTVDNAKGRVRSLSGRVFGRLNSGWYLGGGMQWNQLATTNYSKSVTRPVFGGGKDIVHSDFSMRAQAVYLLKGNDWQNGTQGPELSVWFPSPSQHGHVFYRLAVQISHFHGTVDSPNPVTAEAERKLGGGVTSYVQNEIIVRF